MNKSSKPKLIVFFEFETGNPSHVYIFSCDEKLKKWQCHSLYDCMFEFIFNLDVFRVLKSFEASRECIWFKHYLSKLGWWVSAIADLADAGGVGAQNYGTVAYVIFKCSLITTIPRISFFDQMRYFFHTHLYWNQCSTSRDNSGQLLKFLAGLCTDKRFLGKFHDIFFFAN